MKSLPACAVSVLMMSFAGISTAAASTSQLKVLLDTDHNAGTGCLVSTDAGVFAGIDRVVTLTVTTSQNTASVLANTIQQCSGTPASLSAPVAIDSAGWPAGYDAGTDRLLIESHIPIPLLGHIEAPILVNFVLSSPGSSASTLEGAPASYPPFRHRQRIQSPSGAERVFTLDGSEEEWTDIAPILTQIDDFSPMQLIAAYLFEQSGQLWLRLDVRRNGLGPIAIDDSYGVLRGRTSSIDEPSGVLRNDSASHNGVASVTLTAPPAHGIVALAADGSFSYTNDGSISATDTFRYRASDGVTESNEATVTLNVNEPAPPVAVSDSYSLARGDSLMVPAPGVLSNDGDDGSAGVLSAIVLTAPAHGTLLFQPDGGFTYHHDGSATASDTFTYKAADGAKSSSPATVTLEILCSSVTATAPAVTSGTTGSSYTQAFTSSGGAGAVSFALIAGMLPPGLTLATDGTLSGTPTQAGSFPVTVKATDGNNCAAIVTATLTVACQAITVINPPDMRAVIGTPFSTSFTQTGAVGTATFTGTEGLVFDPPFGPTPGTTTASRSIRPESGSVAGLTLAPNGVLSGTPTHIGLFLATATVRDSNGCAATGTGYTLFIDCPAITVMNPGTTSGAAGSPVTLSFTQSGSLGTPSYGLGIGALPPGLTLASNGTLSGTPTDPGTYTFTVTVRDTNYCSGTSAPYAFTTTP